LLALCRRTIVRFLSFALCRFACSPSSEFRFALGFGSMGLLIARGASVSTYCSCPRFVRILGDVHVLDVSSSFVLRRLIFGSSYQFRFASSSGSLLSSGSAILLIARRASVRICCSHPQFCPRPRFVHILVPAPFSVAQLLYVSPLSALSKHGLEPVIIPRLWEAILYCLPRNQLSTSLSMVWNR